MKRKKEKKTKIVIVEILFDMSRDINFFLFQIKFLVILSTSAFYPEENSRRVILAYKRRECVRVVQSFCFQLLHFALGVIVASLDSIHRRNFGKSDRFNDWGLY